MYYLHLLDFIIKPVQRICKYPLFLMELFKQTPQNHPDYIHLKKALFVITNVVNEINETKRVQENQTRLVQIQQSFVQTMWGVCLPSLSLSLTPSLLFFSLVLTLFLCFNLMEQ
jgi:hypothetical protein